MIKLYHPKNRTVREVSEKEELKLRLLKRAGYKVGKLPALPKAEQLIVEAPLPPTDGEELEGVEQSVPVMAEHAPVEELLVSLEEEIKEEPEEVIKTVKKKSKKKIEEDAE